MMDMFGCTAELDLGSRQQQNVKRKRYEEEHDPCVPAKRPLTEETMATFMHQLQLNNNSSSTSSLSPEHLPSLSCPLNITAVTSCPACTSSSPSSTSTTSSSAPDSNVYQEDRLARATTPLKCSSGVHHQQRLLTPPATVCKRQRELLGSAVTEGLDLASHRTTSSSSSAQPYPVRIRVTPATPPLSESGGGSFSQEDEYEPMDQSLSSSSDSGHGQRVSLEDPSSDSSDSEIPCHRPMRVWIAPELKALTVNSRHFISPPVLHEIAKTELAVVPWVSREKYFARVISRSQEIWEDSSSSDEDDDVKSPATGHSMS